MKFSVFRLALIVLFTTHVSAFAKPDWRRTLINDGWTEIKRKLTDFVDYTWYGQPNEFRSTAGYVYYLRPNGRTGVLRTPGGKTYFDYRREGTDGRICNLIKELRGGMEHCGNKLWKRGDLYMFTNPAGRVIHVWKWKQRNPEGF